MGTPGSRPRLVARDEEALLRGCLESLRGAADVIAFVEHRLDGRDLRACPSNRGEGSSPAWDDDLGALAAGRCARDG